MRYTSTTIADIRFLSGKESHNMYVSVCVIHLHIPIFTAYQRNAAIHPGIRWQYFIGAGGSHIEYPANALDSFSSWTFTSCAQRESIRHRSVYISTALPYPKRVVMLLDYGMLHMENIIRLFKVRYRHKVSWRNLK